LTVKKRNGEVLTSANKKLGEKRGRPDGGNFCRNGGWKKSYSQGDSRTHLQGWARKAEDSRGTQRKRQKKRSLEDTPEKKQQRKEGREKKKKVYGILNRVELKIEAGHEQKGGRSQKF